MANRLIAFVVLIPFEKEKMYCTREVDGFISKFTATYSFLQPSTFISVLKLPIW